MNTTPSRIRWRIAPEKSDTEDRATGDSGCGNPAGDRPNDSVNKYISAQPPEVG